MNRDPHKPLRNAWNDLHDAVVLENKDVIFEPISFTKMKVSLNGASIIVSQDVFHEGFGLSPNRDGYVNAPRELQPTIAEAATRLIAILNSGDRTWLSEDQW
jgi:hypothetical protein